MPGYLYHYFVEGECEKAFIKAFQHATKGEYSIKPGKTEVLNFNCEKISKAKAMSIRKYTKIVVIFDTDVKINQIFEDNIDTLINYANLSDKDIIFIPSVSTFEEELVYSCESLKDINHLFNTKGIEDFKNRFISHKDIVSKLYSVGIDLKKMWSRMPSKQCSNYCSGTSEILEKI